ncbi:MAG: TlpA family protein disulfide reductase [Aedoeadaptatus pacaensis]
MNKKMKKIIAAGLIASLSIGLMACEKKDNRREDHPEEVESVEASKAGMSNEMIKPADYAWWVKDTYEFPYMGAKVTLPKTLQDMMTKKDVIMLDDQSLGDKNEIKYAMLTFSALTEEDKNKEIPEMGDEYPKWMEAIKRAGTLGIYEKSMDEDAISKVTKCDTHTKIGESQDGKYNYYLSTAGDVDQSIQDALKEVKLETMERTPMAENDYVFQEKEMKQTSDVKSIAPFKTQDIDGKAFTEADLAKNKLTMVNVFATWCTACIQEIPDLEKLNKEMKDKGVGVVGVVVDTHEDGKDIPDALDKAKAIQSKLKTTYPFLKPDDKLMNGRLQGIQALPETFFVDSKGNIVGETYTGAKSLEEWKAVVEKELKNVK